MFTSWQPILSIIGNDGIVTCTSDCYWSAAECISGYIVSIQGQITVQNWPDDASGQFQISGLPNEIKLQTNTYVTINVGNAESFISVCGIIDANSNIFTVDDYGYKSGDVLNLNFVFIYDNE